MQKPNVEGNLAFPRFMHTGQPHWFDFLSVGVNALLAGLLVWLTAIQLRRRRPLVVATDLEPVRPGLEYGAAIMAVSRDPWSVVMENRGDAGVKVLGVDVEVSPIKNKRAKRLPWEWDSDVAGTPVLVWLSRGWDRWRRYKPVAGVVFTAETGAARFMPGHSMNEFGVSIPENQLPPTCWIRLTPFVSHGKVRSTFIRHKKP